MAIAVHTTWTCADLLALPKSRLAAMPNDYMADFIVTRRSGNLSVQHHSTKDTTQNYSKPL